MKRCMGIALLLVSGAPAPALAAKPYQVVHRVYGCVDPQATRALNGAEGPLHPQGWAEAVRAQGHCVMLAPATPLDLVRSEGSLVLLRRVSRRPGEPALHVAARDVQEVRPPVAPLPPTTDVAPLPDTAFPAAPAPAAKPSAVVAAPFWPGVTGSPASAPSAPARVAPPEPPVPAAVDRALSGPPPSRSTTAADASPAVWPPRATPHGAAHGRLVGLLVMLLMVASVGTAWVVARRRRHFTRVEEDWLPTERGAAAPAAELPPPPPPQVFRTQCAAALEQAGWATQIAFPGDGTGPDVVARRDGALLVARCRPSRTVIGSEMVDEAAVMGARQPGSIVVLASNAPFSQHARDEAVRQRVHLLHDTELQAFVG